MKKTVLIIIVTLLALVGGMMAKEFLSTTEQTSPTPLPDFNLPDVSGKSAQHFRMARQNTYHQFLGDLVSALPQRNSRIYCPAGTILL